MAERDCEAARQRAATSACALPAGISLPFRCDEVAQHAIPSLAAADRTFRHRTVQHEAIADEAAGGGVERDAAEKEKHISRLRAALKASERQRERQAALHKQEQEKLQSRIEQVTFVPITVTTFVIDIQ